MLGNFIVHVLCINIPQRKFILRFDKREEAIAAIEHLNGTIPHGRTNPISVKIAEEHGKQKAAYFAGWEAGRQQARRKFCYTNVHVRTKELEIGVKSTSIEIQT